MSYGICEEVKVLLKRFGLIELVVLFQSQLNLFIALTRPRVHHSNEKSKNSVNRLLCGDSNCWLNLFIAAFSKKINFSSVSKSCVEFFLISCVEKNSLIITRAHAKPIEIILH